MKKVIYLFIIMICFVAIPNIEAKTCNYKEIEGFWKAKGYDDVYKCDEAPSSECVRHRENFYHSSASFSISASTNAKNAAKFDGEYYKDGNTNKKPIKMNKKQIVNWGSTICGVSINTFINGNEVVCPDYFVVRAKISGKGDTEGYLLEQYYDRMRMLSTAFKNGDGEAYIFLMKLQNKEKKEKKKEEEDTTPKYTSCADFNDSKLCKNNDFYSCMWVSKTYNGKTYDYCNYDDLTYVKCGDIWDLPDKLPAIVSFIVNFIKIVTPIILILVSILSLVKATASSKEEDIKKAQKTLVRRIIAAVIVFFIIQITQFVIFKVADNDIKDSQGKTETDNISTCLSCMINNDGCARNRYYKTMVGGKYKCTTLGGSRQDCN